VQGLWRGRPSRAPAHPELVHGMWQGGLGGACARIAAGQAVASIIGEERVQELRRVGICEHQHPFSFPRTQPSSRAILVCQDCKGRGSEELTDNTPMVIWAAVWLAITRVLETALRDNVLAIALRSGSFRWLHYVRGVFQVFQAQHRRIKADVFKRNACHMNK